MQKIPARILIALLQGYRWLVSPWLGSSCRFHPSCSHYASEALATHGAWRGSWLALARVARCHPWHPGGFDPVPHFSTDKTKTNSAHPAQSHSPGSHLSRHG